MPRSLRVAQHYVTEVKLAVKRSGYLRQTDLAEYLKLSRATVSKFLKGKPVDYENFVIICNALGLDWHIIVELNNNSTTWDNDSITLNNSKNEEIPPGFKLRYTLRAEESSKIGVISWSPDGHMIASGSDDGIIQIWKTSTAQLYLNLQEPSGCVFSIAWSPDGQMLASGSKDKDNRVILWDVSTGKINRILEGHTNNVFSVAWSPDGKKLASGSEDQTIRVWDVANTEPSINHRIHPGYVFSVAWSPDGKMLAFGSSNGAVGLLKADEPPNFIVKHHDMVLCVTWSPDGKILASSSADGTIKFWDTETGQLRVSLEGSTSEVTSISFSANGLFLASKSENVKLWNSENREVVAVIENTFSESFPNLNLAFHPTESVLATSGEEDTTIQIWDLDIYTLLATAPATSSIQYINAKAVLVGESGVGKSGLGIRMAEQTFRTTESTHGAQFWQIPLPKNTIFVSNLDNVQAELTLWDLAGQPDYHLVHQLFLNDTDVALLLFDCSDAAAPFRGIPYWAKVLKKQAPVKTLKYLVSARCDVSPVTVDQREINQKLVEYELDDYFRTCAKTGEGVRELLQHLLNSIPWDKLPRTTTPKLFQVIREFLLESKEAGQALLHMDDLRREVSNRHTEGVVREEEIETVVNLLEARGFIFFLAPTPNLPLVLLRPELINKYASSIIQAARNHPAGIGAILEREVVCANLSFDGFEPGERLPPFEEKLVLESTVELFIRHTLAFREMGGLIFPSQLNILHRIPLDEHPPTEVTYEFSGSVEAIYASLVVCLSYTQDFQRENLWKYAAEFSREGHHLGFAMQQVEEGTGELEIYFYPGVSDFDRVTFIRFIKNHLHNKGIDLQERILLYCSECDEEVRDRKAIERRVQAGKLEIPCQYCDTAVLIPRSIEEKYRSERTYLEKQEELQATVEKRTQQEVKAFRQDHQQYMADSDNCIRILHLSDIHLGTVEQAKRYFTQLATDLTQNLNIKQLNYLVISGDIANCSTEDEYDAAFNLVDKLVKRYGLDPNRVVIVPGNHDINWDLSETAYPFIPKSKLPNPLPERRYIEAGGAGALVCDEAEYKQRFTHFSDRFYKKVYGKPYPLEYDQQAVLHPCPEDKILFLALNSCWEIDHYYRDRAGINSNAISNAVDQILSENYDDWLKIAVWHHPVNGSESMKNPAFLEQLAVTGFQLGIHGHIHEAKDENFQYDIKRGLRVIAAGTFGAPTYEQVTGIPLQYNLLTLNPETGELTVETRKKEKVDGAWSADARWGDKNDPKPRYAIPLRYSLNAERPKASGTREATNSEATNSEGNVPRIQQSIFGGNIQVGHSINTGKITINNSGTVPHPAQPPQSSPSKRTILILAANPTDQARLNLGVEVRNIEEGLRLSLQRDQFEIEHSLAVRIDDLRRALLDFNPEVVHFCGHGLGIGGLAFENETGETQLVSANALARLFEYFKDHTRCVVLNACFSEVQAEAIVQHIDYVVGMRDAIGQAASTKFAVGFYDAFVRGRSIKDAHGIGCTAIMGYNIPEEDIPVLLKKPS